MHAEKIFKLQIPSSPGSEKTAMARAAEVAQHMGFSRGRVEDLKTAVAEACINAMEHSHRYDGDTNVVVTLIQGESRLEVSVMDKGKGAKNSLEANAYGGKGQANKARGWGLYLIEELMDEVKFEVTADGGGLVKMVMNMEK